MEDETNQISYEAYVNDNDIDNFMANRACFLRCTINDGDVMFFNRDHVLAIKEK